MAAPKKSDAVETGLPLHGVEGAVHAGPWTECSCLACGSGYSRELFLGDRTRRNPREK